MDKESIVGIVKNRGCGNTSEFGSGNGSGFGDNVSGKSTECDRNSAVYNENGTDGCGSNNDNGFSIGGGGKPATASRSFSFAVANDNNNNHRRSPFSTLKKQKKSLRSAVLAVKDRFRSLTPRRLELERSVKPKSVPLTRTEDRLTVCRKELDVSLRYLQDVILKDKLVMLPGSASIVLDTVLKSLLVLNEKKPIRSNSSLRQPADSKHDSTDDSSAGSMLLIYDKIYKSLAELLKFTDSVILNNNGKPDNSSESKISMRELCNDLKQAVEDLFKKFPNTGKIENRTGPVELIRRTHSLGSHHTGSSNDVCSILENEEDTIAELLRRKLDLSVSDAKDSATLAAAETFVSADGTADILPPPKPPHPPLVLLNCTSSRSAPLSPHSNGMESNGGCGRSPPSADSGVESLNTTENSGGGTGCEKHSSLISSTSNEQQQILQGGVKDYPLEEFLLKLNSSHTIDSAADPVVLLDPLKLCTPITDNVSSDRVETDEKNTTSEETKNEIRGSRLIKTKKVTTKQIVRHTVVTTKQSIVRAENFPNDITTVIPGNDVTWLSTTTNQNPANGGNSYSNCSTDDLIKQLLLNSDWSKSAGGGGGEIKIKETQNFVVSGYSGCSVNQFPSTNISTTMNGNDGRQISPAPENPVIITTTASDGDANRISLGFSSNNGPSSKRPISVYDNEKFRQTDHLLPLPVSQPPDSDESTTTTTLSQTIRYHEQKCLHQSRSMHSVSRHALINGRLVVSQSEQTGASATLTASKSACFQNGVLKEVKGGGTYESDQWSSRDCINNTANNETMIGDDECDSKSVVLRQKSVSPARLSGVLSYVRIFGSSHPVNHADFCAISLASYVHLRERWRTHEASWRKKAFTFQFNSNSGYHVSMSSTNGDSPMPSRDQALQPISIAAGTVGDRQPWMELDKSATTPRTAASSNKNSRSDFQNLMDFLEMNVDDKLNFSRKFFEGGNENEQEQKYLQFKKRDAVSYVNYLDEIDVNRYLVRQSDDGGGPNVKGGPVDALIAYATMDASREKGFGYQEMFITTYRTFMAAFDLLTKLIYRYENINNNNNNVTSTNSVDKKTTVCRKVARNTFSLIVLVVDDLSTLDFTDDIFDTLRDFLYRLITSGQLTLARYLRRALNKHLERKQNYGVDFMTNNSSSIIFTPFSPKTFRSIKVVDFKSSLLAEQFTYLDWYYFKTIEVSEMLFWAQQQTEERSPNLATFTAHFNKMSYWVRTRILRSAHSKERESIFAKFLKVMRHLQQLGNFNSLFAMLSALDSGSIRRLDWPKWIIDQLTEFATLTDSSQSFKAYRNALADRKPPCLPYIGVILQDLTFIHVGNANFLPESQCESRKDIVNVVKRWQQYTILDNMLRFKAWPYNIKKNEQVLAYLNLFEDYMSEEEIWEMSEKIKPRLSNKR